MKDELQSKEQILEALKAAEHKYGEIFNSTNDGIFLHELTEDGRPGKFVEINDSGCKMTGYSRDELLALTPLDIYETPPDAARKIVQELLSKGRVIFETTMIAKNKNRIPIEISNHTFLLNGRETVSSIVRDISVRKQSEEVLQESENRYRRITEAITDYIYSVRIEDGRTVETVHGPGCIAVTGYTTEEFSADPYLWLKMIVLEDRVVVEEQARKILTGQNEQAIEHRIIRKDGIEKWVRNTTVPKTDKDGKLLGYDGLIQDITERKHLEEQLRTLSLTDELTGLHNRRGFFTLVEPLLKLSKRQKSGVLMLYADLDNLKRINDTFGHQEGDLALIDTADILKKTYRESDIIARIGGDEFVVLPVGSPEDRIEIITARLEENLKNQIAKKDRKYSLSLSFGISHYDPESPCSIDDLINRAEKLMYEQKYKKKHWVVS
jgi:diguanylate cyclase (GGDEF)-like protein/PAS domain S-box-containing protein